MVDSGESLLVTPPTWRPDLGDGPDLVERVLRQHESGDGLEVAGGQVVALADEAQGVRAGDRLDTRVEVRAR